MRGDRRQWAALGIATAAAALASVWLDRAAPFPSAQVSHGSEEAFGRGLLPRELLPLPRGPQRWTTTRAVFRFRNLPPGPHEIEVRVHGHRGPVTVSADGLVVGVIEPGRFLRRFTRPGPGRSRLDVALTVEGFAGSSGPPLGALVDRVRIAHAPARRPSAVLLSTFVLTALCVTAAALFAGWPPVAAALLSVTIALLQALALFPDGLVRSDYSLVLPALLVLGAGLAVVFALWTRQTRAGRLEPSAGAWAFLALFSAWLVQGVAALSPLMVVSDAVFHANNLAHVAEGDLWLTSVTQHSRPFRFPYGISFYALLEPLYRLGFDPVWLVRAGAALSSLAASAGLFLALAASGSPRAGLAVLALQLPPGTFDVISYGNLSNVFGQAMTALFFAWWLGRGVGTWILGAALVSLGALGHFSSLIVLSMLSTTLLLGWRHELRAQRWRALSTAIGLGLALAYYAQFAPLVLAQLPRIFEGSQSAPGEALAVQRPIVAAVRQWGLPAIVLAAFGLPRRGRGSLDLDLLAYWAAGAALALLAIATPLDVRYLYALSVPLSVAMAAGALRLWREPRWGRWAVGVLASLQVALAGRNLVEAVVWRYRP